MKQDINSEGIAFKLCFLDVNISNVSLVVQYKIDSFVILIVVITGNVYLLETGDDLNGIENTIAFKLIA